MSANPLISARLPEPAPAPFEVDDFPVGTLALAEPPERFPRLPTGPCLITGRWGESGMVIAWFWWIGNRPTPGISAHAIFPGELIPGRLTASRATLDTLPADDFAVILAQVEDPTTGVDLTALRAELTRAATRRRT